MMKGSGMACPGALMFAFVLLVFIVVGAQAECSKQEEDEIKSCVPESLSDFIKENSETCNEESVPKNTCSSLRNLWDCVDETDTSSECVKANVVKSIDEGFACDEDDYKEMCEGAASISRASLVLVVVFTIRLLLMSM